MNTNNNQKGANSSYGTLLSLFGRKIKPKTETPTESEKAAQPVPQVTPCAFAQGRRVLIADDDAVFAKATENRLKAHGFEVSTALEGSAVLQSVREESPDVILMDIEFPPELPTSWDGFTIMEWLNQMNWLPNTPIIICTGREDADLESRAQALRAAGVMHKPVNYAALLGMLKSELGKESVTATRTPTDN